MSLSFSLADPYPSSLADPIQPDFNTTFVLTFRPQTPPHNTPNYTFVTSSSNSHLKLQFRHFLSSRLCTEYLAFYLSPTPSSSPHADPGLVTPPSIPHPLTAFHHPHHTNHPRSRLLPQVNLLNNLPHLTLIPQIRSLSPSSHYLIFSFPHSHTSPQSASSTPSSPHFLHPFAILPHMDWGARSLFFFRGLLQL